MTDSGQVNDGEEFLLVLFLVFVVICFFELT